MKAEDIANTPADTPLVYVIGGTGKRLPVRFIRICTDGLIAVRCPYGYVRRVAVRHLEEPAQ
jgi:hypothetical protein